MADKPEIFLEIGAGYFRIPTAEANYNITIIGEQAGASTVQTTAPLPQDMATTGGGVGDDDYYQAVSEDLYHDIGHLAKSLSATIMEIPAEDRRQQRATLDEAGDKLESAKTQLKDIVAMTEKAAMEIMDNVEKVQGGTGNVQELLSELKNHPAFGLNGDEAPATEEEGEEQESPIEAEVEEIKADIEATLRLLHEVGTSAGQHEEADATAEPAEKSKRYLFDLDVIFQTLYELCTNETVKEHISGAREKAAEIFDLDRFRDKISTKAVAYEADSDNYFNVPMSDVFQSLFAACSDKGVKNLLKKMDAGQSTIFLDQAIPLEVPEIEEIGGEEESPAAAQASAATVDPRLGEAITALEKVQQAVDHLPESASKNAAAAAGGSLMSLEDQREIFAKIEAAFSVSTAITADVSKITESLSFQDLSGQRIMKILKLLSDFQVQLLALVVSFGSQLKLKKKNVDISVEESKALAQEDVDKYLGSIAGEEQDAESMLDQQTVNKMLEDFGF
ncbi:MAG: chemotaxis protein CheZ [Desulfobulbaceae bacterium]|nr:MAG: chemotaxis protein CheZ [Desulfobulbaceae bacterium]